MTKDLWIVIYVHTVFVDVEDIVVVEFNQINKGS